MLSYISHVIHLINIITRLSFPYFANTQLSKSIPCLSRACYMLYKNKAVYRRDRPFKIQFCNNFLSIDSSFLSLLFRVTIILESYWHDFNSRLQSHSSSCTLIFGFIRQNSDFKFLKRTSSSLSTILSQLHCFLIDLFRMQNSLIYSKLNWGFIASFQSQLLIHLSLFFAYHQFIIKKKLSLKIFL